jgi:excisionase family DNA binding protein
MKLFTIKEAAEVLRVSPGTVYQLVTRKQLRHERIGLGRGKILIPEDAIEEYRQQHTVGVVSETGGSRKAARPQVSNFKYIRVS